MIKMYKIYINMYDFQEEKISNGGLCTNSMISRPTVKHDFNIKI